MKNEDYFPNECQSCTYFDILTIFKLFIRNFLKNFDFDKDFVCKISKNQQFLVCVHYNELFTISDLIIAREHCRIVDVMDSCEEKNLRETDLIFIKPSDKKSILERLGCTASCSICSALCLGTRDHDEDEG